MSTRFLLKKRQEYKYSYSFNKLDLSREDFFLLDNKKQLHIWIQN